MILNCALIDDEPLALDLLESYVKKTPFLNLIGRYSSAVTAIKDIQEKKIDLLFLDIQMPELNGLEFSKIIPAHTRIVFTTAFSQYALDSYRVNALDYLLKPISYQDFIQAAQKALHWFELTADKASSEDVSNEPIQKTNDKEEELESIFVKSEYKLIQIKLDDILYIEGLKDYLKIHTESNPRPILSLISMKAMEERLPSSKFIRVHRSFIVQKSKIKVIERGRIIFGKEFIPISDSYKNDLQEYLNKLQI